MLTSFSDPNDHLKTHNCPEEDAYDCKCIQGTAERVSCTTPQRRCYTAKRSIACLIMSRAPPNLFNVTIDEKHRCYITTSCPAALIFASLSSRHRLTIRFVSRVDDARLFIHFLHPLRRWLIHRSWVHCRIFCSIPSGFRISTEWTSSLFVFGSRFWALLNMVTRDYCHFIMEFSDRAIK